MKLNFAENIRKLRRENGFTQEQLAEKVGVSFQTVSRWETGVVYPDIETLPILAEIFETRVDELIGCTKNDKDKILEKRWNIQLNGVGRSTPFFPLRGKDPARSARFQVGYRVF